MTTKKQTTKKQTTKKQTTKKQTTNAAAEWTAALDVLAAPAKEQVRDANQDRLADAVRYLLSPAANRETIGIDGGEFGKQNVSAKRAALILCGVNIRANASRSAIVKAHKDSMGK